MSGSGSHLRRVAAIYLVAMVGFALAAPLTPDRTLEIPLWVFAGLAAVAAGGLSMASRGVRGRWHP
jgi:hypothetical protein